MVKTVHSERVLREVKEAHFIKWEKLEKLWNNILLNFENLEENAMTIWITWQWWSWKTSFLNMLFEKFVDKDRWFLSYSYNNEEIEFKNWQKIENNIKEIKILNSIFAFDKLFVININSWLINNIVSDPLYNIISILSKELDFKLETNLDKLTKIWKKAWNWFGWAALKLTWIESDVFPQFWDSVSDILELKKKFNDELKNKLWDKSKLIIVIDDLDRINPEDAVNILDSIKLFLDNKDILIFLLNDKDIVKRWLKHKLWLNDEEVDIIATSYLDKLIWIEIEVEKYYNEETFKNDIKDFIKNNPFVQNLDKSQNEINFSNMIIDNQEIINKLWKIWNMRRIKKLFNNFQIQWPSLVSYKEDKSDKNEKYFEYFKSLIDKIKI